MFSRRHCSQINPSSTCMVKLSVLELLFPLKDKALANHRKTIFWLLKVKRITLLSSCLNSLSTPSTAKSYWRSYCSLLCKIFKICMKTIWQNHHSAVLGDCRPVTKPFICCWSDGLSLLVNLWLLGSVLLRWLGSGKGQLSYSSLFLMGN